MEETCLRFPHIIELISEQLDNHILVKCKEASRSLQNSIENQKARPFQWLRMILSYLPPSNEFAEDWKIIFDKASAATLQEFAFAVQGFSNVVDSRQETRWSQLHIAAERGHLYLCRLIAERSLIKNPF